MKELNGEDFCYSKFLKLYLHSHKYKQGMIRILRGLEVFVQISFSMCAFPSTTNTCIEVENILKELVSK